MTGEGFWGVLRQGGEPLAGNEFDQRSNAMRR